MDFSVSLHHCDYHEHLPAGLIYGPSICDSYCIQFCTKGCGAFIVDGTRFAMKEGGFIVNFPGQTKTEIADKVNPWSLMWITFSGSSIDDLFAQSGISKSKPTFSWLSHKYLLDLLSEIHRLFDSSEQKNGFLLGEKLFCFLHAILSMSSSFSENTQVSYVSRAKHYMDIRYNQPNLTIQQLSDHIGLNRSYLYELFKEKTGISPQQYLTQIRMQKASEILLLPGATVTSVAHAVGYEPSVFSKAFKNYYGISPGKYKKSESAEDI